MVFSAVIFFCCCSVGADVAVAAEVVAAVAAVVVVVAAFASVVVASAIVIASAATNVFATAGVMILLLITYISEGENLFPMNFTIMILTRWSSDPRPGFDNKRVHIPCGATESIEIACLLFYVVDLGLKV